MAVGLCARSGICGLLLDGEMRRMSEEKSCEKHGESFLASTIQYGFLGTYKLTWCEKCLEEEDDPREAIIDFSVLEGDK